MEVEAQKDDATCAAQGTLNLSDLRRVLDLFVERPNPRRAFQQPKLVGFGPKLNSISQLPRQVAYRARTERIAHLSMAGHCCAAGFRPVPCGNVVVLACARTPR